MENDAFNPSPGNGDWGNPRPDYTVSVSEKDEPVMRDELLRIRDGRSPYAAPQPVCQPVCQPVYQPPYQPASVPPQSDAPESRVAPDPEVLKATVARRRRFFSSLGLRYFLFGMLILLVQVAFVVAGRLLLSEEAYSRWYYTLAMLPGYLIAYPLGWWIIARVPKTGPLPQSIPFRPIQVLAAIPISFGLASIGSTIGSALNVLISSLFNREASDVITEVVMDMNLWEVFLYTVICAPIAEELMFRKLLVDRLTRFGELAAILISGFAFGIFHGNPTQFAYASLIGFVLAYIYCKSGKLIWSILIHMSINFTTGFLSVAVVKNGDLAEILEELESLNADTLFDFFETHTSALALYGAYSALTGLLSLTGLVLLVIFVLNRSSRKIHFSDGSERLVKGTRFKTVVWNAGVLLFIAYGVGMTIANILT